MTISDKTTTDREMVGTAVLMILKRNCAMKKIQELYLKYYHRMDYRKTSKYEKIRRKRTTD